MNGPLLETRDPDAAYYMQTLQAIDSLPQFLQPAAVPFLDAANVIMQAPDSPDKVFALRHLLVSRDATLRTLHRQVVRVLEAEAKAAETPRSEP